MTWMKVDDQFAFHPKVVEAGNYAIGLWVRAGAWCAGHLTDGHLPRVMLARLDGRVRDARRLVDVGLWVPVGPGVHAGHAHVVAPGQTSWAPSSDTRRDASRQNSVKTPSRSWPSSGRGAGAETVEGCPLCDRDAGFQFLDWTDWQPSREAVRQARSATARRQAAYRERRLAPAADDVEDDPGEGVSRRHSRVSHGAPTRPDPTSIETPGGCSPSVPPARLGPEPPRRCARHADVTSPGPCRACGDARRDHDDWTRRRASAPVVTAPPCPLHPGETARGCPACAAEATPPPTDLRDRVRRRPA